MQWLIGDFYPPHLIVRNWNCHTRLGVETVGRVVTCLVCDVMSNTRSRGGDARFIRAHRRCALYHDNFEEIQHKGVSHEQKRV